MLANFSTAPHEKALDSIMRCRQNDFLDESVGLACLFPALTGSWSSLRELGPLLIFKQIQTCSSLKL